MLASVAAVNVPVGVNAIPVTDTDVVPATGIAVVTRFRPSIGCTLVDRPDGPTNAGKILPAIDRPNNVIDPAGGVGSVDPTSDSSCRYPSAACVTNTSFDPAENDTRAPAFDEDSTDVRSSVVVVDSVPIPTSHSSADVCAMQ